MMNRILPILTGVILNLPVFAQNPGYLGKKIEVGFNLASLNNPYGLSKKHIGSPPPETRMIKPNIAIGVQAAATLSKKVSFFASHQVGGLVSYDEMLFYPGPLINRTESAFIRIWAKNRIAATNLGLRIYSNKKGSIAPVGAFVSISGGMATARITELEYKSYSTRNPPEEMPAAVLIDLKNHDFEKNTLRFLGFGMGNAMVVYGERVKIEYELMLNMVLPNYDDSRKTAYYEGLEGYFPENYNSFGEVYEDVGNHNIIFLRKNLNMQFRLGLSYLL